MAQKEPLLQDDCPVEECALQSPDVEHRVDLGDIVDPARNKDSARDTFRGTASDEGGLDTRNWAGIYLIPLGSYVTFRNVQVLRCARISRRHTRD